MTLTRPWAIDEAFPNAADQRKQLAAIYPREGVFPDATTMGAGVTYVGTGWTIRARAFVAAIKRGGAPYSQSYGTALVSNDGAATSAWTISAAPASGSRIDLLCIRARDRTQGDPTSGAPGDGPGGAARTGLPEFLVVTGTAATTPVAPALPAGYVEIAQVTTPSAAASIAGSTIVNTYAFASTVGGPIVVRNLTELDALTGVLGIDSAYIIDKGANMVRRGGGWVPTAPAALGKYRSLSAGNIWINATTPTDFPDAADKTALDGTFDKLSATSDVRMTFFALGELASGPEQIITASLNVGGTDYGVASTPFQAATSRGTFAGTRIVSGIPRGTHAVKPRLRTAAANFRIYSGWIVEYTVEEV